MESLGDVGAKTVLQNDPDLEKSMKKRCLQMLQKDLSYKGLPIGLTPVPFSKLKLSELKNMQLGLIDDLIRHLVKEGTTLIELLTPVAKTDEFIDRLLEIYKKTMRNELIDEKPYLSVIRSDFFFDAESLSWKLIEINTVAVAGGYFTDGIDHLYMERGLEANVSLADRGVRTDTIVDGIVHAHKMLLYSIATNGNRGVDSNSNVVGDSSESSCDDSTHAPIYYNDMRQSECIGDSFQAAMSHKCPYAVLVLVGQAYQETFQQDQLAICKKLSKRDIPVILSSFEDLAKSAYDVTTDGRLIFTTRDKLFTKQLTCVYFRSGYDPKHYVDEKCWKFVEDAELSRVVLLPSVGLHLAGTKRVQCALIENDARILKSIVSDSPLLEAFRSTFVSQFELNPGNVDEVLQNPDKYVVKPQREGGTNNLFGQDIVTHISSLENNEKLLSRYIAMELIKGQIVRNYPVRTKDAETIYLEEAVAEVGALSVLVESTTEPKIVSHEFAGLVTKIKRATSNEAGVSVGHGFLSSLSAI